MTYAEIYARRKALGMEHLSIEEFSRFYGNNPEFEAGRTGGVVGQALKAASAGVDRFFSATGLPEASYEFFRHLPTVATLGYADPNEKLGQAAMSLPRGIATMATMPFGVPGLVAGAGAMGVDTYEKTNSAGAGVVGGAMGLATPLAGRVGGGLATSVGTKVAPRLFNPATTQAVASGATNAVAGGVFQSAATRALQFAGQQAGYTGYGALTQGVTGGIAAPDGQGWSAFKEAFTPENLAISAVTSLPFGVNDVMQLRAQGQMVKDYATAQRYDTLRTAERQRAEAPVNAARDALRTEVAKQTMALPWRPDVITPGKQKLYEAQVRNETIADVDRATVRDGTFRFDTSGNAVLTKPAEPVTLKPSTTPIPVAEAFQRAMREQAYETGLLRSVSRQAPPEVQAKLVEAAKTATVEERLVAEDPQVRAAALLEATNTSADDVVARLTERVEKGEDDAIVLREQLNDMTIARQVALEANAALAAKPEDVARSAEAAKEFDTIYKTFSNDDAVMSKFRESFELARESNQPDPNGVIQRAVLKWSTESPTKDSASLVKMLRGADKVLRRAAVDEKSAMSVSEIRDDGTPVFQYRKALQFETREAADTARLALENRDTDREFQWSVVREKNVGPSAQPYFKIVARRWERTAIGGDVTDRVMDEVAATTPLESSPLAVMLKAAATSKQPSEKEAARIAQRAASDEFAVERFLSKVDEDTLHELGSGGDDASRVEIGTERLDTLLRLRAADDNAKPALKDRLVALFDGNRKDVNEFLKQPLVKSLLAAWDARRGVVTATDVKKMLSLVPSSADLQAGGGFYYNVGRFENGRIGKHVLPKSGRVSEAQFAKVGRGDDRPLQKNEIELYKTLVPEAFDGQNVDVPVLLDGLRRAEPTLEVRTLGAESGAKQAQRAQLQHEIETAGYSIRLVAGDAVVRDRSGQEIDFVALAPELQAKVVEWANLDARDESQINDATRYSSVAPRADMPGYVEGLVRVPKKKLPDDTKEKTARLSLRAALSAIKKEQNVLYEGPHFGAEDTNVVGFFRGYMETLPSGEKAFHVIEVQSDWGQQQRKNAAWLANGATEADKALAKKQEHPLLAVYEELALKAAIKHARDNGATRLVLSDAETAMMTEGHDRQDIVLGWQARTNDGVVHRDLFGENKTDVENKLQEFFTRNPSAKARNWEIVNVTGPPQEGGMRLHYDTTLPSALRKITGDKGQRVELGVHKNAKFLEPNAITSLMEADGSLSAIAAEEIAHRTKPKGSSVFRNPDGTPKANITGTVYDISGVAIAERGRGPAFGGELRPDYVGQRRTLSELLRTVGLDDRWLDDTARLVSLYDNHDVAFAELLGATDAAGLFTVQRDGQKLVWLSQQNNPRRSLFALTHELNGHALWQAKREGRLDAETTHRLSQWEQLVADTSPETRRVMLQELWRHLPKEFRKDVALKKLVDTTAIDAEEFHANINAIASLNLVHSSKSVWRDLLTYLPKPLADLLVVMARTSRRVLESINGYLFTREHGFNTGVVNAKARKDLGDYIDTLYGVLKVDRERSDAAAKALRMGLLTDSEARFTAGQNPDYWVTGDRTENSVIQAMGLARDDEAAKKSWLPEGSVGFTRMFGPIASWAVKYPQLQHWLNTGARRAAETALLEKAAMEPLGFVRDGFKIKAVDPEANPVIKLEGNIELSKYRDKIIQRANVANKTVEALIAERDSDVMATLAKMSPEQQKLVRAALAQVEVFNKNFNALILDKKYEHLKFITARALVNKDATMSRETALTLANELIAAQRQGQTFAGTVQVARDLVPFVATASKGIEDTNAYFRDRPYYVSYRRFGKFSVTVKFSDARKEVSPSFDTQAARDEWLRQFDGDPRATVKLHKGKFDKKFDLGQEALDILREHESHNLEALTSALVVNGLDAEVAKQLVGQFSTYGEVQRELAAKSLPGKAPRRRFVAGYEDLNTTEQQMQYLQLVSHGVQKGISDANFKFLMDSPEGRSFVDRDTIIKQWEQQKVPDTRLSRLVQQSSYIMFMLLHPVNMFQNVIQPLVGALPSWMTNQGAGVVNSHKTVTKALFDVKSKKRTTPDEQRMLKWFRDANQSLASYSDDTNNEALQFHNLHAIASGRKGASMGQFLSNPWASMLLHLKQIDRHSANYGMEAAMLAAYRWKRSQGLGHDDAVTAAHDVAMPAMAAQGKAGRAQGMWDAGALQPVTASVSALRSFAMNQLFTAKGTFERAIGRVPGLTAKQRVDAGKAFATTMAVSLVTVGIMGGIGIQPALTIIDKMFDINSREAIADFLRGDEDDEYDDIVQQIAMHGMLSWSGGPDIGARFASSGFLGFNGYDGWSLESMAGTGYDLVKRVFTLPEKLKDEGAGALTSLAPQPFKRGLDAWKDDWEFRRKDGSLIDESTPWEKSIYAVFGVKPTRIANLQERDSWQRLDAQNDAAAREAFVNEMMALMDEGDFGAVRNATIQRAATREGERPDMIAQTLAAQYAERLYGRMASRRAGYNSTLGRTTPGDSMSEVQRLQVEDAIRRQLNMGFATSPQQLQRAREVDAIRALNPTMSVRSARDWVERRYGRQDAMRGATYQYR